MDTEDYIDINSVLNALWTLKNKADHNAAITLRSVPKGYHQPAYYLGEANALGDMICWIEDYTQALDDKDDFHAPITLV